MPMLQDSRYMILPESIGWYWEERNHYVDRKAGTWTTFSIHFVVEGSGFVQIDGEVHFLKQGDAFLYFPLQEQKYYSSKEDPWNIRWVHFYGGGLSSFLSNRDFHRFSLWHLHDLPLLINVHEQLLHEAETHSFLNLLELSTLTYAFLTRFITQAEPWNTEKTPEHDSRIGALLPLMQQQACEPFVLDYWAKEAGVSTYYFCRLFKQATSMTPMSFITLCRLQQSKQWLLDHRNMNVKDIAERAGYPSTSYFNKIFLKQEGLTPTKYRELHGTTIQE